MKAYELTLPAYRHLFALWNYIAHDNVQAADDVEQAILANCELLARNPHAGKSISKLTRRQTRYWLAHPYTNYLIVYEPQTRPLRIVAIYHGARDLPVLLH